MQPKFWKDVDEFKKKMDRDTNLLCELYSATTYRNNHYISR